MSVMMLMVRCAEWLSKFFLENNMFLMHFHITTIFVVFFLVVSFLVVLVVRIH